MESIFIFIVATQINDPRIRWQRCIPCKACQRVVNIIIKKANYIRISYPLVSFEFIFVSFDQTFVMRTKILKVFMFNLVSENMLFCSRSTYCHHIINKLRIIYRQHILQLIHFWLRELPSLCAQ
ncbi:hypothetical protein ASF77_14450 [Massilia sp. Leaf139]|nr:hypothetical protein ASF77_14450 [Massilia sp. Leaf139]